MSRRRSWPISGIALFATVPKAFSCASASLVPRSPTAKARKCQWRYIGEQHVREDVGRIPTAQDWLSQIKPVRWMYGQRFEQHDPHSIPDRIPDVLVGQESRRKLAPFC